MSTGNADDPLAGSRPALANSRTTPPSRSRIVLQTILALAIGCGVLWWIVHTVSSNRHASNEGDPGHEILGRFRASQRDPAARDRRPGKWPDGDPPLDRRTRRRRMRRSGRRRPWPWATIGTDALKAGSLDDMLRARDHVAARRAEGPAAAASGSLRPMRWRRSSPRRNPPG